MKKKLLCAAMLAGLSVAQAAAAQEFDDRWYLTASGGWNLQDSSRKTDDAPFASLGLGKFLSPHWSLDGELNYQNPNLTPEKGLNWPQYGISFDVRRHFVAEGRDWNPYLLMGLGYQRSEEEYIAAANPDVVSKVKNGNLSAKLGVGLQTSFAMREHHVAMRTEIAYRGDFNDNGSIRAPNSSYFGDVLASVGIIIPLGPQPVAAPPPAVVVTCFDLDDDGDGINNCDDMCPDSQFGQMIGPDGCPAPITIDLRGVNFDFDKSKLSADATAILSEAVLILQRYPELTVEVAGHTDSTGPEIYNQKLSERRAKVVYDYLTSNGIDSWRLVGPIGYGETQPIDTNKTREGRAKNRRTELNVQN